MDNQITVLIVDDEEVGREALEGVLFTEGYQLIFASNGPEAYQKALEYTPDVMLLDVMMPQMNGFEVCRQIRQDPVLADMPVLMVTALDDRASRLKGIEAGADDFISKPFDRLELRARIHMIIRLNRFRRLLLERTRFLWAIDKATEGYVMLNQQGEILYANDSAQTWLNLPAQGKTKEPFWERVKQSYVCEPEAGWAQLASSGTADCPLFLVHPEDESSASVWLQVEVFSFPDGQAYSLLARMTDITQKLNLRHQVWSFNARITHKLRAPTANIRMASELLLRKLANSGQDGCQDLVKTVADNAEGLDSEIKDILSYLRMSDIEKSGVPASVAVLHTLVPQLCQELDIDVFSLKIDGQLEQCTLKLTEQALEATLREILENSKKFHPLVLPILQIQVSQGSDSTICLAVQDNGIHISPDKLSQVWLPYYQMEKEFSGEVAGMGLGLSTVAFLVWRVGGKCRMRNRVDQPGVIVELEIPCSTLVPQTS
jgi:DNA-binding response OmpR family regulator